MRVVAVQAVFVKHLEFFVRLLDCFPILLLLPVVPVTSEVALLLTIHKEERPAVWPFEPVGCDG